MGWWVYKTTYYAIPFRGERERGKETKSSYHSNLTSNGAYATSETQNTFFQGHIDQYSLSWKVLCLTLGLQGRKVVF